MKRRHLNVVAGAKALRRRGWSISQLSRQTGLNVSSLNAAFNGHTAPYRRTVALIADALEVPAESLYADTPGPAVEVTVSCTPAQAEATRLLRRLTDQQLALATVYLRGLIDGATPGLDGVKS